MELRLEISGSELKDISWASQQIPRNAAVLYNDEHSHGLHEPHFKGVLKLKEGSTFWALAWLRETHKGRLVVELRLEPKHAQAEPPITYDTFAKTTKLGIAIKWKEGRTADGEPQLDGYVAGQLFYEISRGSWFYVKDDNQSDGCESDLDGQQCCVNHLEALIKQQLASAKRA